MPYNYEILKSFISNFNVVPTWIESTRGGVDKETGQWTGSVGKVNNIKYLNICVSYTYHHIM